MMHLHKRKQRDKADTGAMKHFVTHYKKRK